MGQSLDNLLKPEKGVQDMYKAGATFRDKNDIAKMHAAGTPPDQISAITRVKPEHVKAIIKRIDAGGNAQGEHAKGVTPALTPDDYKVGDPGEGTEQAALPGGGPEVVDPLAPKSEAQMNLEEGQAELEKGQSDLAEQQAELDAQREEFQRQQEEFAAQQAAAAEAGKEDQKPSESAKDEDKPSTTKRSSTKK